MKIATYNIQNLFHRDADLVKRDMGHNLAAWIQEFESLLQKRFPKSERELQRLEELSLLLGFQKTVYQPHLVMRRKAGKLYLRKKSSVAETEVASSITGWRGWIPLSSLPIKELSMAHKARTIREAQADVLLLHEVEDRHSLQEFDRLLAVEEEVDHTYAEHHVLEGNDPMGRHSGIMAKEGFEVLSLFTHCHARYGEGQLLFDFDFQEYGLKTPLGNKVWLLSAHFTADGKEREISDARRWEQAVHVAETYRAFRDGGYEYVAVMGSFNAPSFCNSLAPLLQETDLRDIGRHPSFVALPDKDVDSSYHRLGAYAKGVNLKQRDYLLLSPALWEKVQTCGMDRRGIWPEKRPQWPVFKSLKNQEQQASEHPLLWVDVEL
ncbi:hypothetical protein GTQ34_05740 [Muricauda sp. JGD-17]|uniref:Endonuclease/exonuclease/phosphatase family protein n=1 Tax=Flagellimonas ochracea TaxID=2696472 RepID=A0A964TC20_9FLAO|nr:hypothetical protein [Allomuricauda ochracea]NAY91416.1 hypothetical protein [Allomuricauda ochracea]